MPSSPDLDALLAILKQRLAAGKIDETAYRECEQLLRDRGRATSDTGEGARASTSDLKPDPVLLERWLIVGFLGRGGFGEVFEAIDLDRRQSRAVKLLEPRMLAQEEYLARFRREFEIMRELDHPRVVRVHEYREEPEQRLALISMEYVAGGTVSDLVTLARQQEQPVPLPLALKIAVQTIEALVTAHRREVLHRDVTPRNILLAGGPAAALLGEAERDPQVKLVDFGIAGLVKPSTFSQTTRSLGTMGYVAPEMINPAPRVTPAADLYGVGAVTYELVTGQLPVGRFESPSELRAEMSAAVAEALDSLLLDLLSRNPDERPDAEAALARLQAIEEQWARERVRELERRIVSKSPTSKGERPRRRLARISYAFMGLVLGGLIGLGLYVVDLIKETPPPEVSLPILSSADPSSETTDEPSVDSPAETPPVMSPAAPPTGDDSQGSSEDPSNEPADGSTVDRHAEAPPATAAVATPPSDDSLESSEGPSGEPADALRVESPAETPLVTSPVATPPGDDSQKSTEGPSIEPADGPTVEGPAATAPVTSPVATPPGADPQVDCQREEQVEKYDITMVRICPGTFTMGSAEDAPQTADAEKPAHEVTLREFWIGKYEVTNEQYHKFRPDHRPRYEGVKLPANSVTWQEAKDFCESAGYQLPTEAQWEYAARAGMQTPWSFGANEEDIERFAWYDGNSGNRPHPVGTLKPNPWGLYDMHGNVVEWVADRYDEYPGDAQTDPEGPSPGAVRVLRGGSYWYEPGRLRSASRDGGGPGVRNGSVGFRCVRRPSGEPADALRVESPAESAPVTSPVATPPGDDPQVDCQREEQVEKYDITMVRICPGTFTMGSAADDPQAYSDEKPAHKVTLSEFWIGKYEVTNEQYQKFRSDHRPIFEGAKLPANNVTWHEAKAFCESADYDLPTEAQWEYAARADTQTPWSFGENEEDIGRFAWYDGNSGDQPHPVGTRESNPWGLHDMHGNVWEWVADRKGDYPKDPQIDPEGPSTGAWRVLRGGSFWYEPRGLRSAGRDRNRPGDRGRSIGFRCVRRPRRQP